MLLKIQDFLHYNDRYTRATAHSKYNLLIYGICKHGYRISIVMLFNRSGKSGSKQFLSHLLFYLLLSMFRLRNYMLC